MSASERGGSPLRQVLQRLLVWLPGVGAPDWQQTPAARWQPGPLGGGLQAIDATDDIRLTDLHGIDRQRDALVANTRQFLAGLPANNALLWGARGTGKSSLVQALLNAYRAEGLRVVQIDKHQLTDLPQLLALLAGAPQRFILFCDDLSFEADDASYKSVKSALDGSLFRGADNVLLYATSNRRHLLPESMTDNAASTFKEGELHPSEGIEEKISLSDRFGLWLSFYVFDQADYLSIAEHWVRTLAAGQPGARDLWDDAARAEALRFALARGVRSGRTAQHFARHWVGSHALANAAPGSSSGSSSRSSSS